MSVLSTLHVGGYAPGTTANPFTITTSGTITASGGYALSLASTANWYLLNRGLVTASAGDALDLASGTIVNQGSIGGGNGVVITGTGSVFNQGHLSGVTANGESGSLLLSNASNGSIMGSTWGVYDGQQAATVVNAGAIQGGGGIDGNNGLTLVNDGTILGTATAGVMARQGGVTITNDAGASIGGAAEGVIAAAGATVENYGRIWAGTSSPGTYLDAVTFAAGTANTMILGPGSTIVGTVDGGNALTSADQSVLELAAGTTAGTLYGFNTQFTNFGKISLASGATWSLGGDVTIAAGQTFAGDFASVVPVGARLVNDGYFQPSVLLPSTGGYVENGALAAFGGNYGVQASLSSGAATVINAGYLYGSSTIISILGYAAGAQVTNLPLGRLAGSGGIAMSGGSFVNQGTAVIGGYGVNGVYLPGASPLTVVNSGTLSGTQSGVYLQAGGYVRNASAAIISASNGVYIEDRNSPVLAATVVNDGIVQGGNAVGGYSPTLTVYDNGAISGSLTGLVLLGGTVDARIGASAYAYGATRGAFLSATASATLVVAGTVAAGAGKDAVVFGTGPADRLVVDPGAVFRGTVDGGNTIGGTLASAIEFAAGSGSLIGFGSQVTDFTQITLDTGAKWLLAGSAAGFGGGETISGFAAGSTIELTGTVESYSAFSAGSLTLTGGTMLDLQGLGAAPIVTNDGSNTFITACFASGTRIAGEFGPVPVEALGVGERVRTAGGRLAAVTWLGHRRTDLAKHPRPFDVMPVRVRAGAFGDGLPVRDLVLSPDHAVFVDGRLIPIRYLINGISIAQETRASVTYWHVELDHHDVILAEGMPCESYLDTGNRCAFENAPGAVAMTPEFARAVWAEGSCAPIVTDTADPMLRALHTRLLARASRAARAA